MIHGRYDISGPLDIAWNLYQRWPESELQVIDDAGHGEEAPSRSLPTSSAGLRSTRQFVTGMVG